MLGITSFPFFVIAVLLLNATPGPDTAFIVGRSVSQGRKAGIVSALGISTGCVVHSLAVSFGLTAILAASATAFTFIKFAGAIYLIYLGARMLFASKAQASAPDGVDPTNPMSMSSHTSPASPASQASQPSNASQANPASRRAEAVSTGTSATSSFTQSPSTSTKPDKSLGSVFVSGFWTNVLNPKVILFFVSFFPQFVSATSAHKTLAFLVLGAVFVVMSTVWNGGVAWVAGSVTERMRGRPVVRQWIDRIVGTAFIGLGVRLASLHR